MKIETKIVICNFAIVLLAIEMKNFFDKGGANNELAYSIFKIMFLALLCFGIMHMEEFTKVIIQKVETTITEPYKIEKILSATKIMALKKPYN